MRALLALSLSLLAGAAQAVDISVVGLFPGKAVLIVNNGAPRTYSVGATVYPGVMLVSANQSGAVLEVGGKRRKVPMGQHAGKSAATDSGTAVLSADGRGHFIADGQVNGGSLRMLVDTGATMLAMSAYDATRIGIDYKHGRLVRLSTANGLTLAYLVRLDTVKVGGIVLYQVDAVVQERGLHMPLLGMSFLNRTEMRRDGDTMVLKKRY